MFGSIAQTARDTDYVFTVDTTIEGGATDDTKFIFYTNYNLASTGSIFWQEINFPDVNGVFNWDSAVDPNSNNPIIEFPQEGIYRLRVPTNVTWGRPYHTSNVAYNDKLKITEINNWGNHVMYGGLYSSFNGCSNLDIVCQDTPNFPSTHQLINTFVSCLNLEDLSGSIANWDISNCTNIQSTFNNAQLFNTDVTKWDTSNVTTLTQTFRLTNFNHPIDTHEVINYGRTYNAWNVSKVSSFSSTFAGYTVAGYFSSSFNQDLNNWDTSKGTNFYQTFQYSNFNGNITDWNVSSGSSFQEMFKQTPFNQDISNWDVSKATIFHSMFRKAHVFDQDLSDWDTGQGIDFTLMFSDAPSFNANLQSWDTSNATIMTQMFWSQAQTLSFTNTNQPLTSSYYNKHGREYLSWDTRNVERFNYMFSSAFNSKPNPFNQDISNWDTSAATTFYATFKANHTFNQDITTKQVTAGAGTSLARTYNAWDVSSVVDFTYAFQHAYDFNQPIGNWQINTGSAVIMTGMFFQASDNVLTTTFNQEISQSMVTVGSETYKAWDVSEVTSMLQLFYGSYNFNKDISNWNTKNVTIFQQMFAYTDSFNQNLSKWNTSEATNLAYMFYNSIFTNMSQSLGNDMLISSYYAPSDRDAYITWDTRNVTSFTHTFGSIPYFNQNISNWDTSAATNFSLMFYGDALATSIFNQDISTKQVTVGLGTSLERTYNAWDTKNVINFTQMFYLQQEFNQPIGNWQINTGSDVDITMNQMFRNADGFNSELSSSIVTIGSGESSTTHLAWDTQRVSTLSYMFETNDIFNRDISNWDTSNVRNLFRTFANASSFNQNVSSSLQTHLITGQPYIAWDVSNVTDFTQTFTSALAFNKSVQNWNTVSGSLFSSMFQSANSYNHSFARQNVTINGKSWTSWDVSDSTSGSLAAHGANLSQMFYSIDIYNGEGLSTWNIESASFNIYFAGDNANFTPHYNDILSEWAAQNPTYSGSIGFGNSKYDGTFGSTPSASRSQLETVNEWVITDGGPV